MNRFCAGAACVLMFTAFAGPAAGQLVVVQPGYVQAPFVRVFTNPDGSSYVRRRSCRCIVRRITTTTLLLRRTNWPSTIGGCCGERRVIPRRGSITG